MAGGMDRDERVARGGMAAVGVIVRDKPEGDAAEGVKGIADDLRHRVVCRAGTLWVWREF